MQDRLAVLTLAKLCQLELSLFPKAAREDCADLETVLSDLF